MGCNRRGIILGIAIAIQVSTFQPAMAHESNIPVTLDTEVPTFSVTVPTSLPVWVDAEGQVTTATDAKIINNSIGPIIISNIEITPLNGWELSPYNSDHSKSKVNSHKIGFKLNGDITTTSGLEFNQSNWNSISAKGEHPLTYDATLPPQSRAIVEEVAQVVFTIGWDHAEDTTEYTPFQVTASNRHLMGYTGQPNEDLVIPSRFIGEDGVHYKITSLDSSVFKGCTNLRSVVIPNEVKEIPQSAFEGCSNLEVVDYAPDIEKISARAFMRCQKLSELDLPNTLTELGNNALYETGVTSITIPGSIKSLGSSVLSFCANLRDVTIQEGVEEISVYTFSQSNNIQSIKLPSSLKVIASYAFWGITVEDLIIPNGVHTIGTDAFKEVPHITYHGTATGSPWGAKAIN